MNLDMVAVFGGLAGANSDVPILKARVGLHAFASDFGWSFGVGNHLRFVSSGLGVEHGCRGGDYDRGSNESFHRYSFHPFLKSVSPKFERSEGEAPSRQQAGNGATANDYSNAITSISTATSF